MRILMKVLNVIVCGLLLVIELGFWGIGHSFLAVGNVIAAILSLTKSLKKYALFYVVGVCGVCAILSFVNGSYVDMLLFIIPVLIAVCLLREVLSESSSYGSGYSGSYGGGYSDSYGSGYSGSYGSGHSSSYGGGYSSSYGGGYSDSYSSDYSDSYGSDYSSSYGSSYSNNSYNNSAWDYGQELQKQQEMQRQFEQEQQERIRAQYNGLMEDAERMSRTGYGMNPADAAMFDSRIQNKLDEANRLL